MPLWLPRLSMTTMSPGLRVGTRNCSTPAFAGAGAGAKAGGVDRPVDDAGRGAAVMAPGGPEGQRAPAAMRQLGDQPGAARPAPVAARHGGLGPSFVEEHQAPRIKPGLMCLASGAPAGDVEAIPGLRRGRLCSLACRLFKAEPLAGEKAPHRCRSGPGCRARPTRPPPPARACPGAGRGQVRLRGNPRQQPLALAFQRQRPPPTHRLGRGTAGAPPALRPLDHAGNADPKQRRCRPAGTTARHRSNHPIAQIP